MVKLLKGSIGMLNAPAYRATISQEYPLLKIILTHSAAQFKCLTHSRKYARCCRPFRRAFFRICFKASGGPSCDALSDAILSFMHLENKLK